MSVITISSQVPFAESLHRWLNANAVQLDTLAEHSHHYDPNYLAWETVRKIRNPYFVNGTGFEGYFVGLCRTPEEALDAVLGIGHAMLDSIALMHRFDPRYRSLLLEVLVGERYDMHALYEWNALLGGALARLRCNVTQGFQAAQFRAETYLMTTSLPAIVYRKSGNTVKQEYVIPMDDGNNGNRLMITPQLLKPADRKAWTVVQSVGRFGHPLVRAYLREYTNPTRLSLAA